MIDRVLGLFDTAIFDNTNTRFLGPRTLRKGSLCCGKNVSNGYSHKFAQILEQVWWGECSFSNLEALYKFGEF